GIRKSLALSFLSSRTGHLQTHPPRFVFSFFFFFPGSAPPSIQSWFTLILDPQFSLLCTSRSPIGILIKTFRPKSITRRLDFTQIEESSGSRFRYTKTKVYSQI
ncbi:hypothetical protein DVH24_026411, partial [Malus domestica]